MSRRTTFLLILVIITSSLASAQPSALRSLRPRPKSAFERAGVFTLTRSVVLVAMPDGAPATERAIAMLQRQIRSRLGDTLRRVDPQTFTGGPAILIGESHTFPLLRESLVWAMPQGETMPDPGGYVLDVQPSAILLSGADPDGTFNGVSTLTQLMSGSGATIDVQCAHIWDYPDYPVRWVFSQHNLRGLGALRSLAAIEDTMAALKLNGLQQNDFKYNLLDLQPPNYFDSVALLKRLSAERNIELIPGVASVGYAEGILLHDPNLAEGIPALATYVIQGDTGRILSDPRVTLPNGSFESVNGAGRFTGWSFYDEGSVTVEKGIVHGGSISARCSNFVAGNPAGNCRFNRRVDCSPHGYYRMSAWVRTEGFAGDEVRLLAIGQDDAGSSRVLTFTNFAIPATTGGWRKVEVFFNSLEFNHLQLYAGVWGGRSGTIWWDDFTIEEAGLVNVLRRAGTPLHVYDARTGAERREGIDIVPIVDSVMLKSGGTYPYHAPVTLRVQPESAIANGDTVRVSFFHPITTVVDERGIGQNIPCLSEEKLYDILHDQIARVDTLYRPGRFFLGHDEMRVMNHDSACLLRGMTPAELLADNVARCLGIIDSVHADAEPLVWSDMFDSLHNAVDDYYLVNGDLTGVWDRIPRSLTIVNWNSGKKKESMERFDRLGFRQITSPYYDSRSSAGIRAWRLAQENIFGVRGMMYTTWNADYSFLEPFAYYAWSAGPYIIHVPLDSSVFSTSPDDSSIVVATVLPDPYDPTDSIVSVYIRVQSFGGMPTMEDFAMTPVGADRYAGHVHFARYNSFKYEIVATSAQGLVRRTPLYTLSSGKSAVPLDDEGRIALSALPSPTSGATSIRFIASGKWTLRVIDPLGRILLSEIGDAPLPIQEHVRLDGASVAAGVYLCEVITSNGRATVPIVIVH